MVFVLPLSDAIVLAQVRLLTERLTLIDAPST